MFYPQAMYIAVGLKLTLEDPVGISSNITVSFDDHFYRVTNHLTVLYAVKINKY